MVDIDTVARQVYEAWREGYDVSDRSSWGETPAWESLEQSYRALLCAVAGAAVAADLRERVASAELEVAWLVRRYGNGSG